VHETAPSKADGPRNAETHVLDGSFDVRDPTPLQFEDRSRSVSIEQSVSVLLVGEQARCPAFDVRLVIAFDVPDPRTRGVTLGEI
jgi:hypothetical protein